MIAITTHYLLKKDKTAALTDDTGYAWVVVFSNGSVYRFQQRQRLRLG